MEFLDMANFSWQQVELVALALIATAYTLSLVFKTSPVPQQREASWGFGFETENEEEN